MHGSTAPSTHAGDSGTPSCVLAVAESGGGGPGSSALHAAIEGGRLRRGDHALLLGTGAGISLGGVVLCY